MRHGYRGVIVSWAAWDGERDAMSEEKMSVERGFTSESASGLVQEQIWHMCDIYAITIGKPLLSESPYRIQ
jgi:hypothetical protein